MANKILKKVLTTLLLSLITTFCFAQGSVNWNGWTFDWAIGTDSSGLVLNNVKKDNKSILAKASFPVMRVQYDGDVCGPYADILSSFTFQAGPISAADPGTPSAECNGQRVCQRTFTQNGEQKLELGANAQIGEYQIYQVYYFGEDTIESRVYSRGLQCQIDHVHHAHWLFDFDIGDAQNDQVLINGTALQSTEFNDVRGSSQSWDVKDSVTGDSISVIASPDDGVRDSFSNTDVAIRKYNSSETGRWLTGARGEIGNMFNNGENINGQDIVMWYVTHLRHLASEGSTLWHASGPTIRVNDLTNTNPNPPSGNNILQNSSFDSTANWTNCGDASRYSISGGNLNVSSGACLFQTVAASPGATYTLTCNGLSNGGTWNTVILSMLDSSYGSINQEFAQNTNTSFQTLSVNGSAPSNAAYVGVSFYSEGNATYSDCTLETDATTSNPPPSTGNTTLQNPGFDSATDWTNCGNGGSYYISGSNLNVSAGACVFQSIQATPGESYTLTCTGATATNTWNTFILSTLDSNWQALSQDFNNITTSYGSSSVTLQAPSNASYVAVSFYSQGNASYSSCNLSSTSQPPPPTNSTLLNSDFNGADGWTNCGNASSSSIGGGNLNISAGACVFQTISATPYSQYTLSCTGNTAGNVWSTFILSMLDSNWQSITQNFTPISSTNSTNSVTLTAPSNAAHVAVSFYSEGNASYQNCSLSQASNLETGLLPALTLQDESKTPAQLQLIPVIDFRPRS